MARTFDLSGLSEDELTDLIDEATSIRAIQQADRRRETARSGPERQRQDVNDPNHGTIPTPTPR